MNEQETARLDQAIGRADAAIAMCQMLIHRLGVDGVIPPQDLLALLDGMSLAAEERVGRTPRAESLVEKASQLSLFRSALSQTPGFRPQGLQQAGKPHP